MINSLRSAAGMEQKDSIEAGDSGIAVEPDRMKHSKVVETFDARPMLEAGEHPIGGVIKELGELQTRGAFLLITPFLPAPLIDMAKNTGYVSFTNVEGHELFKTYFRSNQ